MSIRRIGGFNPSVQTANLIQAQRRIEAVEKHAGTEDAELMTEEEGLESLNARHRAELEALEAERARREREVEALRAQLTLTDGYEAAQRELVDLKGGEDVTREASPDTGADKPGVSLAHLARANVYASVTRAERAAAEQAAELERAAAAGGARVEDDWMEAELSALQAEAEAFEEAEDVYSDPGGDSFFASLDDIENLEQGGGNFGDAGANAFVASMDDIALLVPDSGAEAVQPGAAESVPAVIISEEAAVPEPGLVPGETSAPMGLPFDPDAV